METQKSTVWACSACTFENDTKTSYRCKMCQTPKGTSRRQSSLLPCFIDNRTKQIVKKTKLIRKSEVKGNDVQSNIKMKTDVKTEDEEISPQPIQSPKRPKISPTSSKQSTVESKEYKSKIPVPVPIKNKQKRKVTKKSSNVLIGSDTSSKVFNASKHLETELDNIYFPDINKTKSISTEITDNNLTVVITEFFPDN
ncbi:hypothetical protein BLOT_015092 [Blomia tropicalis]|nr:hypothetical protein BLOT_015092 [Blomia tropicalis]